MKEAGEIIQHEESVIRPRNGNTLEDDQGPKKKQKPNKDENDEAPKACPMRRPGMADDEECLACGS